MIVAQKAPSTLDVYFIDTEGGQATLLVTPAGQMMLFDTGTAGDNNRDADRISARCSSSNFFASKAAFRSSYASPIKRRAAFSSWSWLTVRIHSQMSNIRIF